MNTLDAIFGTQHSVTVAQESARAILIFVFGLLLVRVAGRRIFGKWAALDIIVSVVIGSNLSRALTGSAPLVGTLVATVALVVIHWLLSQLAARSQLVSRVVEGRGVDIASDGRVDHRLAAWHGVSPPDIDEALRRSGIATVEETRRVTLEPSGSITALRAR